MHNRCNRCTIYSTENHILNLRKIRDWQLGSRKMRPWVLFSKVFEAQTFLLFHSNQSHSWILSAILYCENLNGCYASEELFIWSEFKKSESKRQTVMKLNVLPHIYQHNHFIEIYLIRHIIQHIYNMDYKLIYRKVTKNAL